MTEPRQKCDTLVTLKEHIEARLHAQQLAVDNARALMEARLESAEKALEARLDTLNHLRTAVLTRHEFDSAHLALTSEFHGEANTLRSELNMLKEWKAEQSGKASMASVYFAYLLAVAGLAISFATIVHDMIAQ